MIITDVPDYFPEKGGYSRPGPSLDRLDTGSVCWARTSDPLINSHRVTALRVNICADFTVNLFPSFKSLAYILGRFLFLFPTKKEPVGSLLSAEIYGVDHLVPELAGWAAVPR